MTVASEMMEPQGVVARLTETQKLALEWLPLEGWQGPAYWRVSNSLVWMARQKNPLCRSRPHPGRAQFSGAVLEWSLTPLGIAVRAILSASKDLDR